MAVTVRDLLNSKVFERAEIIAGEGGLINEVKRANFLGITTSEVNEMSDVDISDLVDDCDFYISGNTFYENEKVDYYEEFKALIRQRSSGICIAGYLPGVLSDEILELCNNNGYPVIALPGKTAFSGLIDAIMNAIIRDKMDRRVDFILHKLINTDCSPDKILDYLEEINPKLYENFITMYISTPGEDITNFLRDRADLNVRNCLIHKYKDGTIFTVTSRSDNSKFFNSEVESIKNILRKHFSVVHVGTSDQFTRLVDFKTSVEEAMLSHKMAEKRGILELKHNDMEIGNWLHILKGNKDMVRYVEESLKTIRTYEKVHSVALWETIQAFVECEGNTRNMAKVLFIHENSVRYRMDKVKEILGLEDRKVSLYTRLNILVRMMEIRDMVEDSQDDISKKSL